MYLILDDAVRKSLIERTTVREKSFNTSLLEHEEEKEENSIYYL